MRHGFPVTTGCLIAESPTHWVHVHCRHCPVRLNNDSQSPLSFIPASVTSLLRTSTSCPCMWPERERGLCGTFSLCQNTRSTFQSYSDSVEQQVHFSLTKIKTKQKSRCWKRLRRFEVECQGILGGPSAAEEEWVASSVSLGGNWFSYGILFLLLDFQIPIFVFIKKKMLIFNLKIKEILWVNVSHPTILALPRKHQPAHCRVKTV